MDIQAMLSATETAAPTPGSRKTNNWVAPYLPVVERLVGRGFSVLGACRWIAEQPDWPHGTTESAIRNFNVNVHNLRKRS